MTEDKKEIVEATPDMEPSKTSMEPRKPEGTVETVEVK